MNKAASRPRGWLGTLAACMGTGADRRNQLWIAGGIIAWAVAYSTTNGLIHKGASVWLVSIPGVIAIAVVWLYARFLRETDEYVRMLQYHGLALAFGLSLFVVALLEALRQAGVAGKFAHESASVMLVSWAAAQLFVAWRHR